MSVRHAAARSSRPGRVRTALGVSVMGAALALGGAFTAHADTTGPDVPEAEKAHSATPAKSTSTGKHAKPYVSGSETPALISETDVPKHAEPAQPVQQPAQPHAPGSETDVPEDAKPAQPVQQPAQPVQQPATPAQ